MPRKRPSRMRREQLPKLPWGLPSPGIAGLSGGAQAFMRRVGHHYGQSFEESFVAWRDAARNPAQSLWSEDSGHYTCICCEKMTWRARDNIEELFRVLGRGRVSREIRAQVRIDDERFLSYLNWNWHEYWWRDLGLWNR